MRYLKTKCISGHGSKLPALFSKNVSADTWDGTTFCLISDKKGDNSSTLICDGKATNIHKNLVATK
jgi:hypothetical protein